MDILDFFWLYFALSTKAHLIADATNAAFETAAGALIWMHVKQARKDRKVKGVSWFATAVFTAWGFFNLLFYPYAGLWISGAAALMPAIPNCFWLHCMWKFRDRPTPAENFAKGFWAEDAKSKRPLPEWGMKPLNMHHAANASDPIPGA